jgi:hypothetical protein
MTESQESPEEAGRRSAREGRPLSCCPFDWRSVESCSFQAGFLGETLSILGAALEVSGLARAPGLPQSLGVPTPYRPSNPD